MLPTMVGDVPSTWIPPPSPIPAVALPFWIVKPRTTEVLVSPLLNVTTELTFPPSITVALGPPLLTTVIAFPMKLIFSRYLPGATRMVSPFEAALIPAWIVGWSAGTLMVAAKVAVATLSRSDARAVAVLLIYDIPCGRCMIHAYPRWQ